MIKRAPRKYLDPDKVEVNPAWLTWREQAFEDNLDRAFAQAALTGYDPSMYWPEAYDKAIPEQGAWILVLEEPYTELRSRFRVPLLSMWRARPHTMNDGGIRIGGRTGPIARPHQAVIATPGGDLHLWPHEYTIASKPRELMACEGAVIHLLGGEPALDELQLFYLQSRGIPHEDAVLMLIEQVATDYAYVTFPEDVTAALEGVGRPLWRHVQLSARGRS